MGYPQESLYFRPISTMGTLLGVHPIVPWVKPLFLDAVLCFGAPDRDMDLWAPWIPWRWLDHEIQSFLEHTLLIFFILE